MPTATGDIEGAYDMSDCDHVWVTFNDATVSVCQNCGATRQVAPLPASDPLKTDNTK